MKKGQDASNRLLKPRPQGNSRTMFGRPSKPSTPKGDKQGGGERHATAPAAPKPPATMTLALTRNPDDNRPLRKSNDIPPNDRPRSSPKEDGARNNKPLPSTPLNRLDIDSQVEPGNNHVRITVPGKPTYEEPRSTMEDEISIEESVMDESTPNDFLIDDDAVGAPSLSTQQFLDRGAEIGQLKSELQSKIDELEDLRNLRERDAAEIFNLRKEVAFMGKEVLSRHEAIKAQGHVIAGKEHERNDLRQELNSVSSNLTQERSERETLSAKLQEEQALISGLKSKVDGLERDIGHLKSSLEDRTSKATELTDRLQQSDAKIKAQEKEIEMYKQTFEELKEYIVGREKENNKLTEHNEYLSNVIAETKKPPSPTHVESHYIDRIDALNHLISSRIAEMCKWEASRTFRASEKAVTEVLRLVEPLGKRDVNYLRTTFIWTLSTDSRRRIVALRFLIGLCLHKMIFEKFALGIEASRGEILRQTEDTILRIEPNFSKTLIIRQAMGRAARSMLENTSAPRDNIHQFTRTVETIFSKLLPRNGSVPQFVAKIAEMATTLANDLTVEQMIFRSNFVDHGTDPKQVAMDVADERQVGRVLLCTFPGFWKLVSIDGRVQQIALRRPSVELQSAFE